jgi:hypothetical protein
MALLSHSLSPVQPAAQRPLLAFVGCYVVVFTGYAAACCMMWRGRSTSLSWIIVVGVAARLFFWTSAPIQSDDAFRYVFDGHTILAGENPYALSPADRLAGELEPGWNSAAAVGIHDHINHAHIPTIYPPLAQAMFTLGAGLQPWSLLGPRCVFTLLDVLTGAVLLHGLRRSGRSQAWIVFYAWNPLVIKEISNTAHLDSLPTLCIVALVWLCTGQPTSNTSAWRRSSAIGGVLGLAILSKLYPVILAPAAIVAVGCAYGKRYTLLMACVLAGLVALAYAPFAAVGFETLTAGLRTYQTHWVNNPGVFRLLDWCFESPRGVALGITAFAALSSALWMVQRNLAASCAAIQTTLVVWLLLLPACFPWYAIPLIALSVWRPTLWSVVLTLAFSGFYLALFLEFHPEIGLPADGVRGILHASIWLTWIAESVRSFAIRKRLQ